jgi:nucleotide-binding universal stress UspA family protein
MTINILGIDNLETVQLCENVTAALAINPVDATIVNVTELNAIVAFGVTRSPALLFDHMIVAEGAVPTVAEILQLLKRRYLSHSKLYHLKKIVVPIDFSKLSDGALRYAYKLANAVGASLEVVHCSEPDNLLLKPHLANDFSHKLIEKIHKHAEKVLQITIPKADTENNETVKTKVIRGTPEIELVKLSINSDLIVIGTSGTNGWPEPFFDNVSAYLSREAHCPVLLVPAHLVFKGLKNIVYAANFESLSSEKIKEVVGFGEKFDSQLHFVHIGKTELTEKTLEQKIFEIDFRYAGGKYPFRFERMVSDDVVASLTEYANLYNADLIVFITEHRDFWHDLLHKSVSREMLFNTKIPMLVAHLEDVATNT